MTAPEKRDHLRAATSFRRASQLVSRACARHHGLAEEAAPPDPLQGLPDYCALDATRALGAILDWQLGPQEAVQRLRAIDAWDPDAVAGLVAEASGWDGRIASRAAGRAADRHHLLCHPETMTVAPEPTDQPEEN